MVSGEGQSISCFVHADLDNDWSADASVVTGSKFKLQFIIMYTFNQLFITGRKYVEEQANTNGELSSYGCIIIAGLFAALLFIFRSEVHLPTKRAHFHDI